MHFDLKSFYETRGFTNDKVFYKKQQFFLVCAVLVSVFFLIQIKFNLTGLLRKRAKRSSLW
jgi:hypothetical protein